jgi:cobalt-zinc-cadmium efflux system membrane fusion protein
MKAKWTVVFVGTLIVLGTVGYFGYDYVKPYMGAPEQRASAQDDHENHPSHSKDNQDSQHESEDNSADQHNAEQGKDEPESHGRRTVHLTPEQRQPLSLTVETAEAGSAQSLITRPATVQFNADSVVQIGPRVSGKVERNLVDLGEHVQEGEKIALMSSTRLGKARAHFLTARARLETEQASYQREKNLFEQDISSEASMLEAKARFKEAQANLRAAREKLRLYGVDESGFEGIEQSGDQPLSYFYLESSIDGVLQKRDAVPGQTIGTNETPYHVVNTESVWVTVDAYEQDIPYLSPGQHVSVDVRSLPNESFEGRVTWVSRELDAQTRTLPVRAVVDNQSDLLKSGMYAQATIRTEGKKENALVPVDAVQTIHKKSAVFVPTQSDNTFRVVPVKTGQENQGMVEIVSGLRPGEKLVTDGAFDLKSILTAKSRSAAHSH